MPLQRPARGDVNGQWLHDKAPGTKNLNDNARRGPSESSEPNSKLIVSNLHYEVTPKDLIVGSRPVYLFNQLKILLGHLWTDRHARPRANN